MTIINVSTHNRRKPYGGYTTILSHNRNISSATNFNCSSIKNKILVDARRLWNHLKKKGKTDTEIKTILSPFYDTKIINKISKENKK